MSEDQQEEKFLLSPEPEKFTRDHCQKCVHGMTWGIENGRLFSRCLLAFGHFPASLNIISCDQFEERDWNKAARLKEFNLPQFPEQLRAFGRRERVMLDIKHGAFSGA